MSIFLRLMKALGVVATPAATAAAELNISKGEAAFIVDAADRFRALFGCDMLEAMATVAAAATVADIAAEREKALDSFQRQMELRATLVWRRNSSVCDVGAGVWLWPTTDGEGEA